MRDEAFDIDEELLDALLPPAEPLPNSSITLPIPICRMAGNNKFILTPDGRGGYRRFRATDAEIWLRRLNDV